MYDLLVNVWTLDADFVFPATEINKKNLRFQLSWLKNYPWLTYSAVEDGAYCRVCILFAQKGVEKGKHERLNSLVQTCVKDWKRALERFKDHQTKRYHLDASDDAQNFKLIYENKKKIKKRPKLLRRLVLRSLFLDEQNVKIIGRTIMETLKNIISDPYSFHFWINI